MKVVGYTRVSTQSQVSDGAGLETQAAAIRQHCTDLGLELLELFTDAGISGADGWEALSKREGLRTALDVVNDGKARGIVVYRLDRLSRDAIGGEYLMRQVWQSGGQVLSCDPTEAAYCSPDDPSDPSRTMVRQMLGMLAEWERSMIALRMRNVRERKRAEGGYCGGAVPYGWRVTVDGRILPEEYEQAIVGRVLDLRDNGWGYQRIANQLAIDGKENRRGRVLWSKQTIRRICQRADPMHGTAEQVA